MRTQWALSTLLGAVCACLFADCAAAQTASSPVAELAKLVTQLDTPRARAELERRLVERPQETFRALDLAVALAVDVDPSREAAIEAGLAASIAKACAEAASPGSFMRRGGADELPAYVLGVTRGLVTRLEAGWRPARGDQGPPPLDHHLAALLAATSLPRPVRLLACEGLGRCPDLERAPAEILLGALKDKDAALAAAARRALVAHHKRPEATEAELRRWAAGLPGPEGPPGVWTSDAVVDLLEGDARRRGERRRLLEGQVLERREAALSELDAALWELESSDRLSSELRRLVFDVVADVTARADEPSGLVTADPALHPALGAAFARGIGARGAPFDLRRVAAARRAAEDDGEEAPAFPVVPLRDELLEALAALHTRAEAEVRAEVYRAAPALLHEIDAPWFERFLEGLGDPETQRAAWDGLKLMSGRELPLSARAWREWYADRR